MSIFCLNYLMFMYITTTTTQGQQNNLRDSGMNGLIHVECMRLCDNIPNCFML